MFVRIKKVSQLLLVNATQIRTAPTLIGCTDDERICAAYQTPLLLLGSVTFNVSSTDQWRATTKEKTFYVNKRVEDFNL